MRRVSGLTLIVAAALCGTGFAQNRGSEITFGADSVATAQDLERLLAGTNAHILCLSHPPGDLDSYAELSRQALRLRSAAGFVYDAAARDLSRDLWAERLTRHGVPVIAVCHCRPDRDWRVSSLRRLYDFLVQRAPDLRPQLDENLRREMQTLRPHRSIPLVSTPTSDLPRVLKFDFSLSALESDSP